MVLTLKQLNSFSTTRSISITFVERVTDSEERWHAIGSIEKIIVLVVVHTYREENSEEVIQHHLNSSCDREGKEAL